MDTLRALLDSVLNWSSSSSDLLSFSRSSFSVWLSLLYMTEFFKSCVLLMTLYLSKVGTTFRRVPEFASSLTSSSDSLWSYRCDHSDTSRFQPSDFQVLCARGKAATIHGHSTAPSWLMGSSGYATFHGIAFLSYLRSLGKLPGRCSAMKVHFWGPYFSMSLIRKTS